VDIHESATQVDPTVVGISTSGTVFVFRDVQETLIRGLQDSTLVRLTPAQCLLLFVPWLTLRCVCVLPGG